jgi:hypothetical protein
MIFLLDMIILLRLHVKFRGCFYPLHKPILQAGSEQSINDALLPVLRQAIREVQRSGDENGILPTKLEYNFNMVRMVRPRNTQ